VGRRFESCRGRHDTKINHLDGNVENQPENWSRDVRESIDMENPALCIGEDLLNVWQVVRYLSDRYYRQVSRYTTSAFMRMKLGETLSRRGLSAYVFETRREAVRFFEKAGSTPPPLAS